MTTRKWWPVYVCFGVMGLSLLGLLFIVHFYLTPSKAFGDAAPPVTSAGAIQAIIAAVMTLLGGSGGFLLTAWNWYQAHHGAAPNPKTDTSDPNTSIQPAVLSDLLEAFPAWMTDRSNVAKERRFWFDLLEMGIAVDPDPETQKWLMDGTEILRKKFFPTPATSAAK